MQQRLVQREENVFENNKWQERMILPIIEGAVKEEKELKTKVKKNIVLLKKTQFEKKRA